MSRKAKHLPGNSEEEKCFIYMGEWFNEVRLGKEKVLFCNHLLGRSLTQYLSKNRLGPPLCIVQLSVFSVKTQ